MQPEGDVGPRSMRAISAMLWQFMRPYGWRILGLVLFNALIAWITPLRQISVAPALNILTKSITPPAESLSAISLNNIGPTILHWLGLDPAQPMRVILVIVSIYVGLTVLQALLDLVGFMIMIKVRLGMLRDMVVAAQRHLLTLPLSFFLRRRAGDLVSRVTNDISATANSLDAIVRGVMQSGVMVAVYMAMLFRTDAMLAGGIVLIGCLHLVLNGILGRTARRRTRLSSDTLAALTHRMIETLQGVRVIKSFAAERYMDRQNRDSVNDYCEATERFRTILYLDQPIRLVINALVIALAVTACFYSYNNGRLGVTGFGLFLLLCLQLVNPLSELSRKFLELQSIMGGAARIQELFAEKNTLVDGDLTPAPMRDGILLRDVQFRFPKGNFELRDINLEIRRGEMVAIVGPSGSGKSTLVDLILRLYDADGGEVLYDGTNVKRFLQRPYRRQFGVVAQESLLFNGSVSDNVVFNRDPNPEAVLRALDIANARGFAEKFPDGIHTFVGDRGVRVSGGERQRIAIARAIYESPSVLVLDEATSALDSESEAAVQEAIDRVTREVTTVVIAHRLSTIQHADKVVVLKDGRIEAVGTSDELLRISPTYRRLYALQFGGAEGEAMPP